VNVLCEGKFSPIVQRIKYRCLSPLRKFGGESMLSRGTIMVRVISFGKIITSFIKHLQLLQPSTLLN